LSSRRLSEAKEESVFLALAPEAASPLFPDFRKSLPCFAEVEAIVSEPARFAGAPSEVEGVVEGPLSAHVTLREPCDQLHNSVIPTGADHCEAMICEVEGDLVSSNHHNKTLEPWGAPHLAIFEMWDPTRKMKANSKEMDLSFEQGPTFRTPRKMGHPIIEN
jgi:hypothetical protein